MTDAVRRTGLLRNDLRALRSLAKDKASARLVDHALEELNLLEIEVKQKEVSQ
jgi:hypothetical protein